MNETKNDPVVTIRFRGGILRVPTSIVPEDSALMHLIDAKCDHDVEIHAFDKVATQETLDHVSNLFKGGSPDTIPEEQWSLIAEISNFVDIETLHTVVVNYYVSWLHENPNKLAKYYAGVEGLLDRVDLKLASRVLGEPIEDRAKVLQFAQFGAGWTTTVFGNHMHISCLAVVPDGRIASASTDNAVQLWDPNTLATAGVLIGHRNKVLCVLSLPDNRLASSSSDCTIKIWDTVHLRCVATLRGMRGEYAQRMVYLPGGRIAAASVMMADFFIKVWDLSTGKCTATLKCEASTVYSMAPLHDGRLACAYSDCSIRLWDTVTSVCTAINSMHVGAIVSLVALPDGRLASASVDRSIRLWSTKTNECVRVIRTGDRIRGMTGLPDGRLVYITYTGSVYIYHPVTDMWESRIEWILSSNDPVFFATIVLLQDGRLASNHGTSIDFWDLRTKKHCEHLDCNSYANAVKTMEVLNDRHVAVVYQRGSFFIWDIRTGTNQVVPFDTVSHEDISCMVAVPNGRLAVGYIGGLVRLLDVSTKVFTPIGTHPDLAKVSGIVVLSNGDLVSCSYGRSVYLWAFVDGNFRTSRRLMSDEHPPAYGLAFVPDGNVVLFTHFGCMHVLHEGDLSQHRTLPWLCLNPQSICSPHKSDTFDSFIARTSPRDDTFRCKLSDGKTATVLAPKADTLVDGKVLEIDSKFVTRVSNHVKKLIPLDDGSLLVGDYGLKLVQPLPSPAAVFLALTGAGVPPTYILRVFQ